MNDYCPRCFIGRLRPTRDTFLAFHRSQLLTIPHAFAYHCDVCHYQEFNDTLVSWSQTIVGAVQSLEEEMPVPPPPKAMPVPPKRKTPKL